MTAGNRLCAACAPLNPTRGLSTGPRRAGAAMECPHAGRGLDSCLAPGAL